MNLIEPNQTENLPLFLTVKEVIKLTRSSYTAVRTWREKKIITAYRIGGKVLFKTSEILNSLEGSKQCHKAVVSELSMLHSTIVELYTHHGVISSCADVIMNSEEVARFITLYHHTRYISQQGIELIDEETRELYENLIIQLNTLIYSTH